MATPPNQQTYTVEPSYRKASLIGAWVGVACALLLVLGVFALGARSGVLTTWTSYLLPSGLFLVFAASTLWGSTYRLRDTRLQVSARGITYTAPGLCIDAPWEAIERIEEPTRQATCIVGKGADAKLAPWMQIVKAVATASREVDRRIPLYMFGWDAHSPLCREVSRRVPHLLIEG
ncbi:hypothetical protein F8S13_14635 [Chloroflexia bacterium SDU3-3]|nr:hypothetical protein F8S13_14635 [Chloroflexia bacterium SDU3-3]